MNLVRVNYFSMFLVFAYLQTLVCKVVKNDQHQLDSRMDKMLSMRSFGDFLNRQRVVFFQKRTALANVVAGTSNTISGDLSFYNSGDGVAIIGTIRGLTSGSHGFHIHENGQTTTKCDDAGAHFNPDNNEHGGKFSTTRHVGDLGNIAANAFGVSQVNIIDKQISLDPTSKNYIVGKTIVIREKFDDLGLGLTPASTIDGNSGARLGCAIIVKDSSRPFSTLLTG